MQIAGLPVSTVAYPRTVRLVSTARLRPPVLAPLADTAEELAELAEIEAARAKSPLDSKVEILHPDGSPVEQVRLQALRDSWFTFRGKHAGAYWPWGYGFFEHMFER